MGSRRSGGSPIPDGRTNLDDLDRLERAVRALVSEGEKLRAENAQLRRQVDAREREIQGLDEKLLELNQRRQDAIKRIDDLVGQVEQLDARLAPSADIGSE